MTRQDCVCLSLGLCGGVWSKEAAEGAKLGFSRGSSVCRVKTSSKLLCVCVFVGSAVSHLLSALHTFWCLSGFTLWAPNRACLFVCSGGGVGLDISFSDSGRERGILIQAGFFFLSRYRGPATHIRIALAIVLGKHAR